MYPAERRDALLNLLTQKGFVSIRDLALQLDVSEITIRRDLKVLGRQGLVEKVVGGGQVTRSAIEPPFANKRVLQQEEKALIGQKALSFIEPGMTIGLSAGTTTWTLAQLIKPGPVDDLTFVTNSTNIAIALQVNGWADIHLTGGQFRTPSDALVGPLAEQGARQLYTDMLFLGAHGVDLAYGFSSPNLQEASINRVLMGQASTVVALFDHTKWGIRGLAHLAALDEVDIVITDDHRDVDHAADGAADRNTDCAADDDTHHGVERASERDAHRNVYHDVDQIADLDSRRDDDHSAELAELRRLGPEVFVV